MSMKLTSRWWKRWAWGLAFAGAATGWLPEPVAGPRLAHAQAAGIAWLTDLEQARQIAAAEQRLILLHFWNDGCPPCVAVERNVFSRPEIARALGANFVPVKIKFDDAPEVARWFKVDRYPIDIIMTAEGKELFRTVSPQDPQKYLAMLGQVASAARPALAAAQTAQQVAQNPQQSFAQLANVATAAAAGSGGDFVPPAATGGAWQGNTAQAVAPAAAPPTRAAYAPANSPYQVAAAQASGAPEAYAAAPRETPAAASEFIPASQPRALLPAVPATAATSPPALAMDGFCPVFLMEKNKWKRGDTRWGAVHRDRTYLFASPREQQVFLANPDRYAPMLSGYDPVAFTERGQLIPGRRDCGVWYQSHMYLFADEASLERFRSSPATFAGRAEQAMRQAAFTSP